MNYGHLACCRSLAIRLHTFDAETALSRKADLDALSKAVGSRSRAWWETALAELEEASGRPTAWRAALAKWGPDRPRTVLDAWREQRRPAVTGPRKRAKAERAARQIVSAGGA